MTEDIATGTGSTGHFKIADHNELPDGGSKIVNVRGMSIALFRIKDDYFAIANSCLHRGGPLGEGEVKGYEVTCPWHGWKFNLPDGSFSMIPTLKVKTFKVTETIEGVFVDTMGHTGTESATLSGLELPG